MAAPGDGDEPPDLCGWRRASAAAAWQGRVAGCWMRASQCVLAKGLVSAQTRQLHGDVANHSCRQQYPGSAPAHGAPPVVVGRGDALVSLIINSAAAWFAFTKQEISIFLKKEELAPQSHKAGCRTRRSHSFPCISLHHCSSAYQPWQPARLTQLPGDPSTLEQRSPSPAASSPSRQQP